MDKRSGTTGALLAVLLFGAPLPLPTHAAKLPTSGEEEPAAAFKVYDTDRNAYLSMQEFLAQGKDDLAFKAADIDGDGRVDRDEFSRYVEAQASE
jgi:Ca2+-binding EF-hand superfamily protein